MPTDSSHRRGQGRLSQPSRTAVLWKCVPRGRTKSCSPVCCAGLSQWLRGSPGSLSLWTHFRSLVIGSPCWQKHPHSLPVAGIQSSSPDEGMLPAITDIGEGKKDKAYVLRILYAPLRWILMSNIIRLRRNHSACSIGIFPPTMSNVTRPSPNLLLCFCCKSVICPLIKTRPQEIHWGMASPFPTCDAQSSHPYDQGKAIMIYSLEHTATQRRPNKTGLFWKRRRGKNYWADSQQHQLHLDILY